MLGTACGDGGGVGPNEPPVANFAAPSCTVNAACGFTSTSSDDHGISSYSWNFDDGSPVSPDQNPSHTFTTAGSFDVSLTVTDGSGETNTKTNPVIVSTGAPTAAFTVNCSSLDCTFTNTSTDNGTITTYSWVFSDGGTSNVPSPTHSFNVIGLTNASATLTVTDDDGLTDVQTENFTVAPPAVCEGGTCDLTLLENASVTITLVSEDCNANGNTMHLLAPVDVTLFTDGCHTAVPTTYNLGAPGQVFPQGTQIKPEIVSGSNHLGFPPTIRIRAGTAYPNWVLEFDDGEAGPGEPDFNDLVLEVNAVHP